jgi:hypothetical protein
MIGSPSATRRRLGKFNVRRAGQSLIRNTVRQTQSAVQGAEPERVLRFEPHAQAAKAKLVRLSATTRFRIGNGETAVKSQTSDDQRYAVQAKMPVCRPAAADSQLPHDGQPMSIRQRELLVREFPYDTAGLGKLGSIEAPDCKAGQRINEREELDSPLLIIAAKEPTVAFGDHQR